MIDIDTKVTLAEFVERFVPHNFVIHLYSQTLYISKATGEFTIRSKTIDTLWTGMDWEITDLQYLKDRNIKPCPYADYNVIGIIRVPTSEAENLKSDTNTLTFSDSIDDIGIIIEERKVDINTPN